MGFGKSVPKHTLLPGRALVALARGTLQDKMPVRYSFGNRYKRVVATRESWWNPKKLLLVSRDIYGSAGGEGTGTCVYWKRDGRKLSIPLGRHATAF